MSDLVRIILMIVFMVVSLLLGFSPLTRYFSRQFTMSGQDAFNTVILMLNVIAIIVMVITIFVGNRSTKEQIQNIRIASHDQIEAIKDATQDQIDKVEQVNRANKSALLSGLILEYKENLRIMQEIIQLKDIYTDSDPEKGRVPNNQFSAFAFQANLNNATINNAALLDKIVQAYSWIALMQNFMDSAKNFAKTRQYQTWSIGKVINLIETNSKHFQEILPEVIRYREKYYGADDQIETEASSSTSK